MAHISAIYIIDIRTGDSNQIQIENSLIKSSEKLLGIKFDQQLPLDQQLSFDQDIKSLFEKANVKKTKSVRVGCSLYGIRNKKKKNSFFSAQLLPANMDDSSRFNNNRVKNLYKRCLRLTHNSAKTSSYEEVMEKEWISLYLL